MKTIMIMSKDQKDYTINPSQITHIYEDNNEIGTWIVLSCGKKIFTKTSIHDIINVVNNA